MLSTKGIPNKGIPRYTIYDRERRGRDVGGRGGRGGVAYPKDQFDKVVKIV